MSELPPDEQFFFEELISEAQYAASKYINEGRAIDKKVLDICLMEAKEFIDEHKYKIRDAGLMKKYRMNLLVPLQIRKIIEERENDF